MICSGTSAKARHVRADGRVVVCQVDGRHWLALEGPARVVDEPGRVSNAERRYAARYREPRPNPARVVLEIAVARVLGSTTMTA